MPKSSKKRAAANEPNPEALPSAPDNSLFGSKKSPASAKTPAPAAKDAAPPKKRRAHEVLKEDPAVAILREAKRRKKADDVSARKDAARSPRTAATASGAQKAVRPHSEAVEQCNKLWERLRSEKTQADERSRLIDEVLALFGDSLLSVLQKHDAARVLQSCFKQGSAAQREVLMSKIAGEARGLARSHYGHFLLISVLRHGNTEQKQRLFSDLQPHVAELVVHAEGSGVLQLLYTDVASGEQKNAMFRAMWGKEIQLLSVEQQGRVVSLADLFQIDPLCKVCRHWAGSSRAVSHCKRCRVECALCLMGGAHAAVRRANWGGPLTRPHTHTHAPCAGTRAPPPRDHDLQGRVQGAYRDCPRAARGG